MKKLTFICIISGFVLLPAFVFAQSTSGPCSPVYTGPNLCNAIPTFGGMGVTDLKSFMLAVFGWIAGIIGTLAMVMFMFSGAKMIFSQGDPGAVKEAKSSFAYSIAGFLVVIFGYVIVSGLQFFLGVRTGSDPSQRSDFFYNPLDNTNLQGFFNDIVANFLGLIGTVALFYLIWNGFKYVTAGPNEEQSKSARQGVTWAIFGLISVLLSYTIVMVLLATFNR